MGKVSLGLLKLFFVQGTKLKEEKKPPPVVQFKMREEREILRGVQGRRDFVASVCVCVCCGVVAAINTGGSGP